MYGPSDESRLELADRVREIFRATRGVVDIDWYVEALQPKSILRVDREKAALSGYLAGGDLAHSPDGDPGLPGHTSARAERARTRQCGP